MRISDWSSDVCSSDLAVIAAAYPLQANPQRVQAGMDELYLPIARTVINNSGVPGATNIGRQWLARTLARDPWEGGRSEEHTSELQSLMRHSYAVLCLTKKKHPIKNCTIRRTGKQQSEIKE